MFSKYLFVYKTRIIRSFTYKFEVYGNILMQTIIMITTSFFWRALFQDKAFGNGITADSMMTYTIMSSVLSVLFITGVERRIQESVEKGTIAIDLMRPVNIFGMFLAEDLGSITALLIQNLLPILLLGSLLIRFPAIVSLSAIPLFAASVILSMAINWLLAAIFGMWAFTAISMDPLYQAKKHLIRLLSGSIIPIWFFPKRLAGILNLLPFVYIYQLSLDIYIGSASNAEIYSRMLIQLSWVLVLGALFYILSGKSLKKVLVQGG